MIKPSSGGVQLFGKAVGSKFKDWNDIGYLVERPYSYPNLSVTENLKVYYHLRQLKNPMLIPMIIDKLKLTPYANIKSKQLSLGNQQRLGLAKALMHRPKLLILDEPINGLDPEGIVEVRDLLKELVHKNSAVLLSSHILGEISKIANRIGIIDKGKLINELTSGELTKRLIKIVLVRTNDNKSAMKYLEDASYDAIINDNNEIEIRDETAISHPEYIARLIVEHGLLLQQLYLYTEDLEKFFLRTTKKLSHA